ncbi:hypothetical protein Tco_0903105 [Tanacetum coccineum]
MQTPLQSPPRSSSQPEGEHIKKDKGKKGMSFEEAAKESTESDSDDEAHVTGSMKLEEEAKAEAAKQEGDVRKAELIDLLGLEVVHKKGPITFKVYREDGTYEVILNFKVSDLHLGTRMDCIHTTKAELGINLDIPLSKQDPLDKLNDLANKKRNHVDNIHDYFKANKRLKSSVQYEDHLPGTMLNEHVLGMIMFSSYHRQDLVTIEDLKDFLNAMLYTVQEIFFRRHQGPEVDNHARTFISLLLAEVDKRNLNLLKQMRTIE